MKRLVFVALGVVSALAQADEPAEAAPAGAGQSAKSAPVAIAVQAADEAAVRPQPADEALRKEERAKARARREKYLAERKAAREAALLEVVLRHVPDEAKANALVRDLLEAEDARRRAMRRPRPAKDLPPAAK